MGTPIFKYTGALSPDHDAHLYIERPEDMEVREKLARVGMECVLISLIGARQMGKTSLIYRLLHEYTQPNGQWIVINLDLSSIKSYQNTQWYVQLINRCCQQINRQNISVTMSELQLHCEQSYIPLYSADGWAETMRLICQKLPPSTNLVLALDELSTVPQNQWENFFSRIRAMHETAKSPYECPEYRKLAMILVGSFVPKKLIQGENSPFNVSSKIYMSLANREHLVQIQHLMDQHGITLENDIVDTIFDWTNGVLYHVQRFCEAIVKLKHNQIDKDCIDAIAQQMVFDDTFIQHVQLYLQENVLLQKIAQRIYNKPFQSNRNTDTIASLEIKGAIYHDLQTNRWNITNRLCRQALEELFSTEEQPMTGLEPIFTAALTKAVDFLFGEAGKLLDERRKVRQDVGKDDDTPVLKGEVTQKEVLVISQDLQTKNIYLRDLPNEVDHILRLIESYRSNRRILENQIRHAGGVNRAPIDKVNDLQSTDDDIRYNIQRLKDLIQKAYSHQINLVGLD